MVLMARTPDSALNEKGFARQFANITADEMRCKCGTCLLPIEDSEFYSFCVELQVLRSRLGFPFHFTSFYRCPAYNDSLYVGMEGKHHVAGEHLDGPHTIGAADLAISFERMYQLVREVVDLEMGIGIKQHGSLGGRYVHIDNLGPRLWTYQ